MILTELEQRVDLRRKSLQKLPESELASLIADAQSLYLHGLSATRAGEETVARSFYQKAFELLPTHVEALDNCAISLVEELRFADALPLFEQSAYAEPSSPLAFLYLTKCYQETSQSRLALLCIQYLKQNWPDKSPVVDWSQLGQPQPAAPMAVPPFSEGQVWRFNTPFEDDQSRIWIRLVELEDGNPIVHISVVDVTGPEQTEPIFVSHLPYDATALAQSVTELTDEQQRWNLEDDNFGKGFLIWNEAFREGKAGAFALPVSDVVDSILQQMANQ